MATEPRLPGSLTSGVLLLKREALGEWELSLSPNQGREHKPALLIFSYEKNLSPGASSLSGGGGLSCWPRGTAQSIKHSRRQGTKKQS